MNDDLKRELSELKKEVRQLARLIKTADSGMMDMYQASRYLGYEETKLRKLVKERKITYYQPERKIFFAQEDLDEWVRNRKVSKLD